MTISTILTLVFIALGIGIILGMIWMKKLSKANLDIYRTEWQQVSTENVKLIKQRGKLEVENELMKRALKDEN